MTHSPRRFFRRAVLFELGLGAAAVAIGWLVGVDPLADGGAGDAGHPNWPTQAGYGIAATLPLVVALLLMDRYPLGPLRELQQLSRTLLVPWFAPLRLWQLFVLSASAGIGEEILYRGLLQGGLQDNLPVPNPRLVACLAASAVFGICHWLSATYAALATLVGLYLGALYVATGSLIAPAVAHGMYDFAALVYLVRQPGSGMAERAPDEGPLPS